MPKKRLAACIIAIESSSTRNFSINAQSILKLRSSYCVYRRRADASHECFISILSETFRTDNFDIYATVYLTVFRSRPQITKSAIFFVRSQIAVICRGSVERVLAALEVPLEMIRPTCWTQLSRWITVNVGPQTQTFMLRNTVKEACGLSIGAAFDYGAEVAYIRLPVSAIDPIIRGSSTISVSAVHEFPAAITFWASSPTICGRSCLRAPFLARCTCFYRQTDSDRPTWCL